MQWIVPDFSYTELYHAQYVDKGYCIFERFLTPQAVEFALEQINRMLSRRSQDVPIEAVFSAHHHEQWIWDLATQPKLLDMLEKQCGPNLVLWASNLLCKPPHTGLRVPWHQDAPYWNVRGRMPGAIWIAFDDIDAENGGMCVLPGWHNRGTLPRRVDREGTFNEEIEGAALPADVEQQKVQYVIPAGAMATHDTMIPHTSEPNQSDRWRRALILRYIAADGVLGEKDYRDYRTGEPYPRRFFLVRGKTPKGRTLPTMPELTTA